MGKAFATWRARMMFNQARRRDLQRLEELRDRILEGRQRRDPRIWQQIGELYLRLGRKPEGIKTLQHAQKLYREQGFDRRDRAITERIEGLLHGEHQRPQRSQTFSARRAPVSSVA